TPRWLRFEWKMSLTQVLSKSCRRKDSLNNDCPERPPFILREPQDERRGGLNHWRFPFMLSRVEEILKVFIGINKEGGLISNKTRYPKIDVHAHSLTI